MTSQEWFHTGMVGPNEYLQETDSATVIEESLDVAGSISDIDGGAFEADSSSLIDEEQEYPLIDEEQDYPLIDEEQDYPLIDEGQDSATLAFIQGCLTAAAWVLLLRSTVIEESLDVAGSISDIDGGALEADSSSLIDEEQDYHSVIDSATQSFIQRCLMAAARAVMLKSQVISAEYRFLGLVR